MDGYLELGVIGKIMSRVCMPCDYLMVQVMKTHAKISIWIPIFGALLGFSLKINL